MRPPRPRDARVPVTVVGLMLLALTIWSLHRFRRYQPLADLGRTVAPSGLEGVGLQIREAAVTGREEGRMRWRVLCRTITLSRDRRQITVDDVQKGVFYGTDRRPIVSIRAGHAQYTTLFGDIMQSTTPIGGTLRLFGGIEAHILIGPGVTLQGTDLTWDALHNAISSPGQTTARFPEGSASGQGLLIDSRTGDLSLHNLHGTFIVPAAVQEIMFNKPSPRAVLTLGGSLALTGASAAPAPPAPFVTYDAGESVWLHGPNTYSMSKGVTFNQDDAYLKTDAAVVKLDDQQRALNAKSQGTVHIYNPQDDLTGRQGFIDFTRHLATLNDDIVLVIKPGTKEASAAAGSLRSRFKDAATLTCDQMTYDYRRKIGRVPGRLTVHQKDRVLTADSGEYDTKAETITLVGNVHGHNGEDEIQAPRVVFGLKEGAESITIPAPTHGRFRVRQEQEDDTPRDAAPPPPAPPPAPASSPSTEPMTPNSPPADTPPPPAAKT